MHDVPEHPAEMGRAEAAEIRQVFDGELLAVILLDIVQGGSDGQGISFFLLLLRLIGTLRGG